MAARRCPRTRSSALTSGSSGAQARPQRQKAQAADVASRARVVNCPHQPRSGTTIKPCQAVATCLTPCVLSCRCLCVLHIHCQQHTFGVRPTPHLACALLTATRSQSILQPNVPFALRLQGILISECRRCRYSPCSTHGREACAHAPVPVAKQSACNCDTPAWACLPLMPADRPTRRADGVVCVYEKKQIYLLREHMHGPSHVSSDCVMLLASTANTRGLGPDAKARAVLQSFA